MPRLRTVSPESPGWRRRRQGRGFVYLDGSRVLTGPDLERCKSLVIPPAWTEVWICPLANGHLQAVGTDEAGRRQYLYHPQWRERRDREKFDYMIEFASHLAHARPRVSRDLRAEGMPLTRACAVAFRLFDVGAFRIGSEHYAQENGSHGLLTLERRHVRRTSNGITFSYVAKSGQERSVSTADPAVAAALATLRARRASPAERLMAYKDAGRWRELNSQQLSDYLKKRLDDRASAKDFRTWQANLVAAAVFATATADTATARKRAISHVMDEVAQFLGNTPAVARSSYVDPRLVELFRMGSTIDPALARRHMPRLGRVMHRRLEQAVIDLLG